MNMENESKQLVLENELKHGSKLESDYASQLFCDGYKKFLDTAKTERLAVKEIVKQAQANGFSEYTFSNNQALSAGDKVYYVNNNKSVILAVIGYQNCDKGMNIVASHIDAPRLDLKVSPLYESDEIAYFKTHYYGGIKKYQWTTVPLSLEGVIYTKDGKKTEISIGSDDRDPILYISDLLPHLAQDQMKKEASKIIEAEELNAIVGSKLDTESESKDKTKARALKYLFDRYGIDEKSFLSAELELVPAMKARDCGLDRSMVAAYGQDDRSCAYCSLKAIFDIEAPARTTVCVFADKEEIGSCGNTGLQSKYLEYFIESVIEQQKGDRYGCMLNSRCLSADVNAAYDPTFSSVFDSANATHFNYGVTVNKYTGSGGKYSASDASAEYTAYVQRLFDANDVQWQCGELGKVDKGGGGTVAQYLARLGMNVIDVGVPVMSMHAPYELTAKNDVHQTYKAIKCFIEDDTETIK